MSANGLKTELRGGIRVLTLANPPGNALTPALRQALLDAIATAPGSCTAIVPATSTNVTRVSAS